MAGPVCVTRTFARRGTEVVARLSYAGPVVTVRDPGTGEPVGRLVECGTGQARPVYNVLTAKHPAAAVPSDEVLAYSLGIDAAVALLLDR